MVAQSSTKQYNVAMHNTGILVDCPHYTPINIPCHAFAGGVATVCADATDTDSTVADDAVDLQETESSLALQNKKNMTHIIHFAFKSSLKLNRYTDVDVSLCVIYSVSLVARRPTWPNFSHSFSLTTRFDCL